MAHYGIGELTAVTILAELGDCRRFSSSRQAVRYAGMDITVHQSDQRRSPGHLSRQGPPALRWALFEAAQSAARPAAPTVTTTSRPPSGSAATARAWRSRASCSSAATTRCASSARRRCSRRELPRARTALTSHRCAAAGSRHAPAATSAWTALKDRAAATLPPAGSPHQTSCRRPGANPRVADRNKAGRPRAHDPHHQPRTRTPSRTAVQPNNPDPALDTGPLHK